MVGNLRVDPLRVVPQRQPGGLVERCGPVGRLGRRGDVADPVQGEGVQASCSSGSCVRTAPAEVSAPLSLAGSTNR